MQYSLDRAIHDAKFNNGVSHLTNEQQSEIIRLVGKKCRANTVDRLVRRLTLPLSVWKSYGIYSRLILADDQTPNPYYICGQSWTDEMRTLRECILDK